jgi:hypothetical protein
VAWKALGGAPLRSTWSARVYYCMPSTSLQYVTRLFLVTLAVQNLSDILPRIPVLNQKRHLHITVLRQDSINTEPMQLKALSWSNFDKLLHSSLKYFNLLVICLNGEVQLDVDSGVGTSPPVDYSRRCQGPVVKAGFFLRWNPTCNRLEECHFLHDPTNRPVGTSVHFRVANVDNVSNAIRSSLTRIKRIPSKYKVA